MKYFLSAILLLVFITTNIFIGQADPFSSVEEKLESISEEEKEVLEQLFKAVQEIDIIKNEEKQIAQEIESLHYEIKRLENDIKTEEENYRKKQDGLKQILRTYQRMGLTSYIEIILKSDSLNSFLRRINVLRDLSYGAGQLLKEVEESKNKLMEKRTQLSKSIALLESRNDELKNTLDKKSQLKAELEEYLYYLGEKKEHYENYLEDMQLAWSEIKNVFSNAVKEFSEIVQKEILSPEDLNLSFSFNGVKGGISEKLLNDIIINKTNLEPMKIDFENNKIQIEMPAKKLILKGHFTIKDGHALVFEAEEGSFFGMRLEHSSIEELFSENQLILDLKPMIGNKSTLKSINIKKDYLELMVEWKLF